MNEESLNSDAVNFIKSLVSNMETAVCVGENCEFGSEPQPLSNFHKDKNRKNGYNPYCKLCRKKLNQKYKPVWQKANKRYKQENKEAIKKYEEVNKERLNKRHYTNRHKAPYYDTYQPQLESYYPEALRRDLEDEQYLQVKCKKCQNWFTPTNAQVKNRLSSINLKNKQGESHFYCTDECKNSCDIYGTVSLPKNSILKKESSRDTVLQREWSQAVLNRDVHECQICGSKENLSAHHIESIHENELMSLDIENGIALCDLCHLKVHSEKGCRFVDLQKINVEKRRLEKCSTTS